MEKETEILAILKTMKDVPKEIKDMTASISTLNTNVAVIGQKVKTVEEIQKSCKAARVKIEDELDEKVDKLTTNGATAKAERTRFSKLSERVGYVVCLLIYAFIIYIATNGGM